MTTLVTGWRLWAHRLFGIEWVRLYDSEGHVGDRRMRRRRGFLAAAFVNVGLIDDPRTALLLPGGRVEWARYWYEWAPLTPGAQALYDGEVAT